MNQEFIPNRNLAAVCGLYCGACGVYLATQENDVERLQAFAKMFNTPLEEIFCDGCGAERKSSVCIKFCNFIDCAKEKNVEFCGSCDEYPCMELKVFQSMMPHRLELWKSQERIKEVGWEIWEEEMNEHFTCPKCNTVNSAYYITCRQCGNNPSCDFTKIHYDKIMEHISKR